MIGKYKISAIVPVYNEDKTVANVVWTILLSPTIDEVICVNDNSTDNSQKILKSFGDKINLITLKENKGKGWAVAEGIRKSKGEVVAFFDADLITLEEKYIKKLVLPLATNKYDQVIGQRFKGIVPASLVFMSGERAFYKKDLLAHLDKMKTTRFGLEIFLNRLYKNKRTKVVYLLGLWTLLKHQKRGTKAIRELLKEYEEVIKELTKNKRKTKLIRKLIRKIKDLLV